MRLGGVSEVAAELEVSSQRISQLRRTPGFPEPIAELSAGPVWDLDQVVRWETSGLRRRSGRPARNARILGGRFELEGEAIGSGGFADVYRALDLSATVEGGEDVVAVKVLRVPDTEGQARFRRELRLLESISHPNIVPVLGSGEDEAGKPWYAMPLARGNLLDELEEVGKTPKRLLDALRQVCSGLEHLHKESIFHRDLTPMNVLRTAEGSWAISDFGLAREAERRTTTITSMHVGLGTFLYQAPEAMTDARNVEEAADIYSLGKVLHALVKGDHPMPGEEPPPGPCRSIIRRATRVDRSARYPDTTSFLRDLELALDPPTSRWELGDEVIERLQLQLRRRETADSLLDEVLFIALEAVGDDDSFAGMAHVLPYLKKRDIDYLWRKDSVDFRLAFVAFAELLRTRQYQWEFCDTLADFAIRATDRSNDDEILRHAVSALAILGENHNRWHVRSVFTSLLQEIRTPDRALVALEGLREARGYLEWNLTDFTVRSLHPILRVGIEELISSSA